MSCHHCPPPSKDKAHRASKDNGLFARLLSLTPTILPEGSALLSSSCCWLPTALDFVFSGSVTTTAVVHRLRPVFLAISIATLVWSIVREGLTRRNIVRAIVCAGLLAWTEYSQMARRATGHTSCH